MGRSRLQCNDITFAAWRRVTRSRCGVATRAMRRLQSQNLTHWSVLSGRGVIHLPAAG
jgi:hypothetical protein